MSEPTRDFQQLGVDFQNSLREFIERTDELSKNSLKRVCKALAAHPLEDELIELIHEDEEELYDVGKEIQSIKLSMMVESLKQDAEEERIKESRRTREQQGEK